MAARAKFKVESVVHNGVDGGTVKLTPVVSGTINEAALTQFDQGAEFYVDFTRVANV